MHTFLSDYGLFLAKTLTFVVAFLFLLAASIAILFKNKLSDKPEFDIKKLNEKYQEMTDHLHEAVEDKKAHKKYLKALKQKENQKKLKEISPKKRVFVLNFNGDIRASAVDQFREEITAVLTIARITDEIAVRLESPGGLVHSYGLAASQLERIKEKKIPLTILIDKIAASGGYLMACAADKIIASPFALIGSIGVVAQLPNFHRLLKKSNIDFEQITAGKYKRTLTLFGENTEESRHKFQESLEEIHFYFKDFIAKHRPQIDLEKTATGEHWLGSKAFELNLVDKLQTSDEYLFSKHPHNDIFEIQCCHKKSLKDKLSSFIESRIADWF